MLDSDKTRYLFNALKGDSMTYKEICDIYDYNPNLTLAQLSKLTGKPIAYLKKILMKG
jgi:predicted transcriptional regulator